MGIDNVSSQELLIHCLNLLSRQQVVLALRSDALGRGNKRAPSVRRLSPSLVGEIPVTSVLPLGHMVNAKTRGHSVPGGGEERMELGHTCLSPEK